LLIALLIPLAGFTQMQQARINHIPAIKATAGQDIQIEATLQGASERPSLAYIFYKPPDKSTFKPAEMFIEGDHLTGVIPGTDVTKVGIEYYLEVQFGSGDKLVFPLGAPQMGRPFSLTVKPKEVGNVTDPAVVVLSPDPGAEVEGDDVLIALTLMQHVRAMKPENLRLELNGVDVTSSAMISEEIITLSIEKLRPGNHSISLFEEIGNKQRRIVGWGFSVAKIEAEDKAIRRGLPFNGTLAAKYSHEDISSKVRDVTILDGDIRGLIGSSLKWKGKFHVTSLEDKNLQSQNRFLGQLNWGNLTLKGGDSQPRFSQFSMWGVRQRGFEMNYHGFAFNLDVASGSLLKAIEGEVTDTTTVIVVDALGDTLKTQGDPTVDSTRVDSTFKFGTFNRKLLAVRAGFPLSDAVTFSFNMMKAKDDVESIDYGTGPKDNLVLGGDLNIKSANKRFEFNTEVGISLYNSDISGGAMSQAEQIESMIVVNQFFEPLPTDSAILDPSVGRATLMNKVMSELVASSMAFETSVKMNYLKNELKLGYKSIGRSFKSLGSPGVQTDIKGFSISDRMRLFNNRVYINFGFDNFDDNVNDRAETTVNKQTVSGGMSFYTPPALPNISFNTRMYNRKNDAEILYVVLPDGSLDSTGNPVEDLTTSYDFAVDQAFNYMSMDHNAAVSYSNSESEDKRNPDQTSDLNTLTFRLSSQMGQQLQTSVAYSLTGQTSQNGANVVDYNAISSTARYTILPKMLWLSGGLNMTFASGGLDVDLGGVTILDTTAANAALTAGYTLDFNRIDLSTGLDFTLNKHHEFGLSFSKVFHSDDGYVEVHTYNADADLDGVFDTPGWSSEQTPNKDSDTFIEQDDMVVRLRYTFKF